MRLARIQPSRRVWIFDLDNTLHDARARIFPAMHEQINAYLRRYFGVDAAGADEIRTRFWRAYGTTLNGLFTLAGYFPGSDAFLADCPACQEQEARSTFITHLNAGGETNSSVRYTVIESANDEVVTPYTSAFLTRAPNVTNILLQDQCALDQGEHLSMPYDHIADADVLTALDPTHPVTPACTPVLPVSGG